MRLVPAPAVSPQATPGVPLPVPQLFSRHYTRNYVDLFQEILRRLYTAGDVNGAVSVHPGTTVGTALDVTEQSAAAALATDDSVVLALVATIAADSGVAAGNVETITALLETNLRAANLPTFEAKADALETGLGGMVAGGTLTEVQLDQLAGAFRSVGGVIADVLAFEFPRLDEYRIDLDADPEKYVLITGSYTAVLSADPDEVLTCTSLKQSDQLDLVLTAESFEIDADADFEFFKVKPGGVREKHEMVMRAIGTLRLEGIRITIELDDELERAAAVTWAPGHDARRANWTRTSASLDVDSVALDVLPNAATILLAWFEFAWTVANLEADWEDEIRKSIAARGDIAALGAIARGYISPIALRLMPIAYVLSAVRYGVPFEPAGVYSFQEFEQLESVYAPRSVGIMNPKPEPADDPDDGSLPKPPDRDDVDDWHWPPEAAGMQAPVLDLADPADRAQAVALVTRVTDLSKRTRAIAALDVERFSTWQISLLRSDDVQAEARLVAARAVCADTIELLADVSGADGYVFRDGGASGRPDEVRAAVRDAKQRMSQDLPGDTGSVEPVPGLEPRGLDKGIWGSQHADESPLEKSRGSASDPGWIGLSTNCVVATRLYRKLRDRGLFVAEGVGSDPTLGDVPYELRGCHYVGADFTGDGPDHSPGLALGHLTIALQDEESLKVYEADARVRLEPIIYWRGCLPESAVTEVFDARACLESMTGTPFPEATWMREVAYRDFVFLRPHVATPSLDVELFNVVGPSTGKPPTDPAAWPRIRAALAHWAVTLPEVPILYNSFRPLGGAIRDFNAADGWLSVYRRYPFRDFSGIELGA